MRLIDRAARTALTGMEALTAASGLPKGERRAVSVYLLVTVGNVRGAAAAYAAGCTKQNVSKLVRAVEARREDRVADAEISRLERILGGGE